MRSRAVDLKQKLSATSSIVTPAGRRRRIFYAETWPDSEERTGIRFETERVYGYSGSEGAGRQTLSPGDRAIRGSRR